MEYTSTRNSALRTDAAAAIITGLASDGGLFVPTGVPKLNFEALRGADYYTVAAAVLGAFLPEYEAAFLKEAIETSYGEPFGGKVGRLKTLEDGTSVLELWHGPTAAFKDYALQLMPKLLVEARRMKGETDETLILVATSGDTGGAALAGYAGLPGIRISVFYPTGGTSEIQRLQMVTQEGENVAVYAVSGNFDDAQRGVKAAFGNEELRAKLAQRGKKLSSANSINWGRLVPQIVYYATSYLALCEAGSVQYGQPVDYCVPTGNFGDIMAGYYAKAMGLPVGQLVCAANRNNVLADFLKTGRYDAKRSFYKTSSPSMDILVSSNLERLLYHESGSDETVRGWMQELAATGEYTVDEETMRGIRKHFAAGWADEDAVGEEIRAQYEHNEYLCDPHTAVAFRVLRDLRASGALPERPAVVLSTASPFKFGEKVLSALGLPVPGGAFEALQALQQASGRRAPASLAGLQGKPVRFDTEITPQQIPEVPLSM